MRLNIVALFAFFSLSVYALEDMDRLQIQKRIQPVGKVRVEDQNDNSSQSDVENKAAAEVVKKESGQETYEQYCVVCHRDGLAGAPKFRDANDWKPHMQGKKIDDLLAIVITGVNAMPAKGTCIDCSDAELKDAILYMMPKS